MCIKRFSCDPYKGESRLQRKILTLRVKFESGREAGVLTLPRFFGILAHHIHVLGAETQWKFITMASFVLVQDIRGFSLLPIGSPDRNESCLPTPYSPDTECPERMCVGLSAL